MKHTENAISWVHRLAALAAVAAFAIITLGTLVASNAAVMAAHSGEKGPAWGWSFFFSSVKYESAYRILVAASALLAIGLAISLKLCNQEPHVRILGFVNALAGIAGIFVCASRTGALQSPAEAALLEGLAQIYFVLCVSLALFTRTDWNWNQPKVADVNSPSYRGLLVFATAATWIASILGTQTRPSVFPHLLAGCVVTLASLWAVEIALNKFSGIPGLKIPAILLAELTGLQLFLGIVDHSMELNARATSLPMPGLNVIRTTHAAVGALVLASSLYATFQAFKYLAPKSSTAVVPVQTQAETEIEACDSE